jgi:16S rRNA processing protein RimM
MPTGDSSRHDSIQPRPLEVGRIERPHGLRGEVVVKLSTNVLERVAPGSVLMAGHAPPRPLTIRSSRPHQHRYIVVFEGVDTRAAADELHGVTLYAEPVTDDDPDTMWVHDLIGREVIEMVGGAERSHGPVVAVIDNPASDLLELEGGGLVPLRFVVDHTQPGRLIVEVPAGLLDGTDGEDGAAVAE